MDGISALMDGELEDKEAQRLVVLLKSDEQSRERWDEFHLIGDTLRGEPLLSAGFSEALSKRLAEEPTVLAPRRIVPRPGRVATYALSAAASVSAAALVAWVALAPTQDGTVLAGAKAPVTAAGAAKPEVQPAALANVQSDGSMNDLLFYHQGVSPSTIMQGVSTYIRTVSTTRRADGR